MPNLIANVVLLSWVPISVVLFRMLRPVTAATIVTIGSSVLMPAALDFDFKGLPPIDRHTMAGIGGLLGYLLGVPKHLRRERGLGWPEALILIQMTCAFLSVIPNSDALQYGPTHLPGLSVKDGFGRAFDRFFTIGVPFFLGSRLVRRYGDLYALLRVFVFFGLAYVPIILWEVRMSPQLHANLYGYFPHSFAQHIRQGGFRPVGFTSHGLELALFMATCGIAAMGLARARFRFMGLPGFVPSGILVVALVLCKSFASLVYGTMVPALMLVAKPIFQVRVVMLLAIVVLSYPMLRSMDLFPTTIMVEIAKATSEDRAQSLAFRFHHEDKLLEKARERIWLGWGTWGRNRIYDEETGRDISVTDGYWILEVGMFGMLGFMSFFGLMLLPVFAAAYSIRDVPPGRERTLVVTVMLMVLVRAVDLIPNAFPATFVLFLSGALIQFSVNPPKRRSAAGAR